MDVLRQYLVKRLTFVRPYFVKRLTFVRPYFVKWLTFGPFVRLDVLRHVHQVLRVNLSARDLGVTGVPRS